MDDKTLFKNQQQILAEDRLKTNTFHPPKLPPLLQFTQTNDKHRTQVNDFFQLRNSFPKKFNLTSNPEAPCQTCGQTTHSRQGCWKNPMTYETLKSTDERDKFFIRYLRKLPQLPIFSPPETGVTADWFMDTFWPEMITRENEFFGA